MRLSYSTLFLLFFLKAPLILGASKELSDFSEATKPYLTESTEDSSATVQSEFTQHEDHETREETICAFFRFSQKQILGCSEKLEDSVLEEHRKILIALIQDSCDYSYLVLFHALFYGDSEIVDEILQRSSLRILTETELDLSKITMAVDPDVPKTPLGIASYNFMPSMFNLMVEHFFFFFEEHSPEEIESRFSYRYSQIKNRTKDEVENAKESLKVEGPKFFSAFGSDELIVTANGNELYQLSPMGAVLLKLKNSKDEGCDSDRDSIYAKLMLEKLAESGKIQYTDPVAYLQNEQGEFNSLSLFQLAIAFDLFDFLEYLLTQSEEKIVGNLSLEQVYILLSKMVEKNNLKGYHLFQKQELSYLAISFDKIPRGHCFAHLALSLTSGYNDFVPLILKSMASRRDQDEEAFENDLLIFSHELQTLIENLHQTHGSPFYWRVMSFCLKYSLFNKPLTLEDLTDLATHADEKTFVRIYNSSEEVKTFILDHWKLWKNPLKPNPSSRKISDFVEHKIAAREREKRQEQRKKVKAQLDEQKRKEEEEERVRKAFRTKENKRVKEFLKPLLDFLQKRPHLLKEKKYKTIQSASDRKRERLLKKEGLNETQFEDLCHTISESPDCQTFKSINLLYQKTSTSWEDVTQHQGAIRTATLMFFLGQPLFFSEAPFRVRSDEELQVTLDELYKSLITHYEKEAPGDFLWDLPYSKESLLVRTYLTVEGSKCVMTIEAFILRDGVFRPFLKRLSFSLEELLHPRASVVSTENKTQRAFPVSTESNLRATRRGGGSKDKSASGTAYDGTAIWKSARKEMDSDEATRFFREREFSYKDPHTTTFLESHYSEYEEHVRQENQTAFKTVFTFMLANPENSPFTLVNENDSSIQFRCFHKSSGRREVKSGKASIFWTYEGGVFRLIAIGSHKSERSYNIEWVNEDWVEDTVGSRIPSGVYSIE